MTTITEPTPDAPADARERAERQAALDQRRGMEGQIGELRSTAAELRSEAAALGEPFELAMRDDGPDTWMGRRADDFRVRMLDVRGRLTGGAMTSVRYELENAALECELRANAMEQSLPIVPELAVPRPTG